MLFFKCFLSLEIKMFFFLQFMLSFIVSFKMAIKNKENLLLEFANNQENKRELRNITKNNILFGKKLEIFS